MGAHGPIPKRAEDRRRRNKVDTDTVKMVGAVPVPPAHDDWHPIALHWYESLAKSGQAKYYEPSDWAAANLVAHQVSAMLFAGRPSPTMFAAVWTAMGDLLTTEGERRRARMEVARETGTPAPKLASVTPIDRFGSL